ncbi:MAG: hypothetical protein CVU54_11950 [Deltaproteobacteria bacterium HGW-Deltaproteobacteria-12]|jgi:membrane associated rhomboid family serine protease|nr:MAG: hypothetical protein CVU54_11950 [Deltaproteobacteria bacterium HGW-Deltaproteobacteria-12]
MTKEQKEEQKDNKPPTGTLERCYTPPGLKEKKPKYILIIILNIIITLASLFVYHNYILKHQQNQNIVGVDIKGFLEKQKAGMVNGKISEEQFKANMDKLEVMVNDLGKRKVVLMSDVILRGAEIVGIQ